MHHPILAKKIHTLSLRLGYNEPYDPRTIPCQPETTRINWLDLLYITQNTLGVGSINSKAYANSDRDYKLVNPKYIHKFLQINPVNKRVYVPEKNDCDDYAVILNGDVTRWDSDLAFGEIWGITPQQLDLNGNVTKPGYGHAWNFFVSLKKEVWFVEPQTDHIFKPTIYWTTLRIRI